MNSRRIELQEYEVRQDVQLSRSTAKALSASNAITVTPSTGVDDGWDLRASHWVGVVQTGDFELRINPKVPMNRLLFLMSYTMDTVRWKNLYAAFADADDLVTAIAHAFLFHVESALSRGVLQGYQHREDSLPVLRGRVRVDDQIRRRYGLPVPLEVSYDDFTIDILENRLLKSAARILMQTRQLPDEFRRRLVRIDRTLDPVGIVQPSRWLPDVPIDRRNRRYAHAIYLAQLILRSSSIEFEAGSGHGTSFLVKMYDLFERFVTLALTKSFSPFGGRVIPQYRALLDAAKHIPLIADLVWQENGLNRMVADIKYKSTENEAGPNADVYQALAYSVALGLEEAHLIYARGNDEPIEHYIPGADKTICVHAVDLDRPPDELLQQMDDLAVQLATSAKASPRHGVLIS